MRLRRVLGLGAALGSGLVILGACAHGRAPPPPPPPPPPTAATVIHGDATGVVVQNAKPAAPAKARRTKGREIDPSCRYCVTDDPGKRQYFDQRRNRYYYFDRAKKAYFWENGEPKV